jgi:S1-C subfamily serine protease
MKRLFLYCLAGLGLLLGGSAVCIPLSIPAPVAAQTKPRDPAPPLDLIAQLNERFETIVRKVGPAVVAIEAVKPSRPSGPGPSTGKTRPTEESGSGLILHVEGKFVVLTNHHVVAQSKPEQITIHLADGRIFRPGKVWADPETDVALLSLDGALHLPSATLGDSDTAKVGHLVLAIGSPFGLNQTVSHGIISARERGQVSLGTSIRIKDFLQTDAAINPGSSGGPLIDMKGEVIGINTAIASQHGASSGVAFSIPSNLIKRVMKQLMTGTGTVSRGYLGMQLALTFEPTEALKLGLDRVRGALVEKIYPDTPAAAAGLQAHDVILQIDSIAVKSENHFINLIANLPPGQRIRLQVWRNRTALTLDAVVGDWSKAQSRFRTD